MWPIIKKAINSDLSTPLNIPINAIKAKTDLITQIKSKTDLITGKYQLFLENGIFVVPAGVYAVYLTGCAAGDRGYNGGSHNGSGGGDGGEMVFDFLIPNVTPGQTISVTTGTGNTVFGPAINPIFDKTYLTLTKGGGAPGGGCGAKGEDSDSIMGIPYRGKGGAPGGVNDTRTGGGGGGAFGVGGKGGYDLGEYGGEFVGQPGTGYGTGGGGGCKKTGGATGAGGAGGPGFLLVRWL